MEKHKIVLWVIIAVLMFVVLYTVFFGGGTVVSSAAAPNVGQGSQYAGMVGGC